MSETSYLKTLSSQRLWYRYLEDTCLAKLGLYGDFSIKFPEKTLEFINSIARDFSKIISSTGQKIGESRYKNFRPEKTRLGTEEVGLIWQDVRSKMQEDLGKEYGHSHEDFLIPGIKAITVDQLEPLNEAANRIMKKYTQKEIQEKLDEAKGSLTRDNFWETLRTVVFTHWQKEFDLYKGDENEPAREIPNK